MPPSSEQHPTDAELVAAWQEGRDRDRVFGLLVRRHEGWVQHLFRQGFGCDREVARDLAQETFVQAWQHLEAFEQRARFTTWLRKIARNRGLKWHRDRRALKRGSTELPLEAAPADPEASPIDPPSGERSPADRLLGRELLEQVSRAAEQLTPADRQILYCRAGHEMSEEETARVVKKPVGTVKSAWHRIRKRLRRELGGSELDLSPLEDSR
ncbi:MAG: sigma-70 family RNA polymerase sigma factor [Holophagales bacterium]|nr:sigma-70 family RNA polymerase sigma factor [Holophagales bacterium]